MPGEYSVPFESLPSVETGEINPLIANQIRATAVQTNSLIFYQDRAGNKHLYTGDTTKTTFGYSEEEWNSHPKQWIDSIHVEDQKRVQEEIDTARKEHRAFSSEYRIVGPDGNVFWIKDSEKVVQGINGQPEYYQSIMQDITAYKTETAARDNAIRILEEQLSDLRGEKEYVDALAAALSDINAAEFDEKSILEKIAKNMDKLATHFTSASIHFVEEGEDEKPYIVRKYRWNGTDKGMSIEPEETIRHVPLSDRLITQEIVQTQHPLLIQDTSGDNRWIEISSAESGSETRSYIGIPLIAEGKVIGVLNINNKEEGAHYTEKDLQRLLPFAEAAAVAIHHSRLHSKITELSITDVLTGLSNRRHLFDAGDREVQIAKKRDRPLVAIMTDIDGFKPFNEKFGHDTGDIVLATVATTCIDATEDTDIKGRYGGEEFVFVLPETDFSKGFNVAERLRKKVEETKITSRHGELNVNISLGMSLLDKKRDHDFATLCQRADEALGVVKHYGGKNAVGVYIPRETGNDRVAVIRITDEGALKADIFQRKNEKGEYHETPISSFITEYNKVYNIQFLRRIVNGEEQRLAAINLNEAWELEILMEINDSELADIREFIDILYPNLRLTKNIIHTD